MLDHRQFPAASFCLHSLHNSPLVGRVYCRGGRFAGRDVMSMQPWARWFYKSKAWRRCREAYIAYRHGLCERCGAGGKIVHHKIYLTPDNINDPEITLNFDNLELLCQECHNREHHETVPAADGLRFTADGDLVEVCN